MSIRILEEKCNKCLKCLKTCSFRAIEYQNDKLYFTDKCVMCKACINSCQQDALYVEESNKKLNLSIYSDVWVLIEIKSGKIDDISYELLGKGRELANQYNEKLCAVLVGENVGFCRDELEQYHIDLIYCVRANQKVSEDENLFAELLTKLANVYCPNVFIIGATYFGKPIAARIAAKLQTGLTADCIQLEIYGNKEKHLLQTRPAFSGDVMAQILCENTRPQMVTVRKGIMKSIQRKKEAFDTKIVEVDYSEFKYSKGYMVLDKILNEKTNKNGACAEVIVAGGRGIESKEGFLILEQLAEKLNGRLVVTRPIIEKGWYPESYLVGQTGISVSPKVYFAFGISGALQHLAGVHASVIIAINHDENATIFTKASYGIVGDAIEVCKLILNKIK